MLAYSGKILDSRTIAASINTNPVVVRRLLLALRRAGLIETSTGKRGGATLTKPPSRITLLDIYDAVAWRPAIAVNRRRAFRACPVSCSMKTIVGRISHETDQAIRRQLGKTTLHRLISEIR